MPIWSTSWKVVTSTSKATILDFSLPGCSYTSLLLVQLDCLTPKHGDKSLEFCFYPPRSYKIKGRVQPPPPEGFSVFLMYIHEGFNFVPAVPSLSELGFNYLCRNIEMLNPLSITSWVVHFEWVNKLMQRLTTYKCNNISSYLQVYHNIGRCLCTIELRNVRSLGLGFGLEPQTPGLGLGLETCWTRTRVLASKTRTRQNVDSLHLCIFLCSIACLYCCALNRKCRKVYLY